MDEAAGDAFLLRQTLREYRGAVAQLVPPPGFDRYLVFGSGGRVYEAAEPVWDEGRVVRTR